MKNRLLLVPTLTLLSGICVAQPEVGRVISSTPVMQQVAVPRQICSSQPVVVGPSRSGGGAVLGALAGGAIGNQIGHGAGRAAATVIGMMSGAAIGDRVEGGGAPQVQQIEQCSTQTTYENRVVAYNVVYEYAGRQYSIQMPNDPGPTVRVQVSPVGAVTSPSVVSAAEIPVYGRPVYVSPPPVVYPRVYPPHYYYDSDRRWEREWNGR